ncbi:MAG: type I secretion system permease/ATPase [Pseudomonadota bacterium]
MARQKRNEDSYPAMKVYKASWFGFVSVGFFSFFVNLGALASPIYMQQIFDRVMQSQHVETLIYLTAIVIFFLAIISILDAIRGAMLAKISHWWDKTVHSDLLVAIIQIARAKGISKNQAISDLVTVRQFVGGPSILPFFDGPWMPLFVAAIMFVHPVLGILAIAAAVILFILALINDVVTRRSMAGLGEHQMKAQNTVDVATRHAESVYSMGMIGGIMSRFNEDNAFVADAMYNVSSFTAKIAAISKFVRFTAQILVLGLGAYFATLGEMTSGGMIAASIILGRALAPAEQALGAWRAFVGARAAHRRIMEVFAVAPSDANRTKQPEPSGKVEFLGVSLLMHGAEKPILRSINVTFEPGNLIAVIGPSGSGKSTFCKMLIGALEPTHGSVRLDGASIGNWDREQFGSSIGYLAQSVQLMDGTIKDNIARMGEPDDIKVLQAAQLAGCHDMINKLPNGYDTEIGTFGMNLSGGQAQRIGLARALYGNPKLVVLDEPNSNLDAEGDAAVQNAIGKMRDAGTTVVIVSHKPAALANVDMIVTIADGSITKQQTRDEYLKSAIKPVNAMLEKLAAAKQGKSEEGAAPKLATTTNQPVATAPAQDKRAALVEEVKKFIASAKEDGKS